MSFILILLSFIFPIISFSLRNKRENIGWRMANGFCCESCKEDITQDILVVNKPDQCESCKRDESINKILGKKIFFIDLRSMKVITTCIIINIISLLIMFIMMYMEIKNYWFSNSLILISNILIFCNYIQNSRRKKNITWI